VAGRRAPRLDGAPDQRPFPRRLGEVVNVSREHFQIEQDARDYVLVDRGSACGTIVEGRPVGGDRAGRRIALHDQDLIIVATSHSPLVFKFRAG